MAIKFPFYIGQGDTTNNDKLQANFKYLEGKLNNEAFIPATLADADAPDSSLYFSSDANKLVYKDSGGTVHALW